MSCMILVSFVGILVLHVREVHLCHRRWCPKLSDCTQCLPSHVALHIRSILCKLDMVVVFLLFAETVPPLIQLLKSMLIPICTNSEQRARTHCTAYIATTLRNQATLQLFLDHAVDAHLHIVDISSQARQSCVQFQHHMALKTQRSSIFIHKINAAHGI